jgi:hypothetical protein
MFFTPFSKDNSDRSLRALTSVKLLESIHRANLDLRNENLRGRLYLLLHSDVVHLMFPHQSMPMVFLCFYPPLLQAMSRIHHFLVSSRGCC